MTAPSPATRNSMKFHSVIPFTHSAASLWEDVRRAPTFDASLSERVIASAPPLVAVHDIEPLTYLDEPAVYLWANPQAPDPRIMLKVEGDLDPQTGQVDMDSLLLHHGPFFRGFLIYQKPCCPAPSLLVIEPGMPPLIIDNIVDTKMGARNFWKDRVFAADLDEQHKMLHGLQDAMGFCGTHAHNAREYFQGGHHHRP